jgi:two-component system C4-dicarboxylate transport response regulator DctD
MPDIADVLYVEDDPAVRMGTTQSLQIAGYRVRAFESAEQVLKHLVPGFRGVLLTDVKLPGITGQGLLERVQAIDCDLPVILVTGHGDVTMAVQSMRAGAYDFIEKPYGPEQLAEVVGRALERRALLLEVASLRTRVACQDSIEERLLGRSLAMSQLRKVVLDIASTTADVLVVGETGSGKELVARCLHDFGPGKDSAFAALNCGGLPEAMFESEVFGHEAGSFTGAAKRRIGKIEHAARGTLFLDEIETMSPALQVKLLRTLQERRFERMGSNELLPMQCRVVAATKTDLLHPLPEAPFRSDLYYRLSVVVLNIPALRERREDIPGLFHHFLLRAALRYQRPVPIVTAERTHQLMTHTWPGNVRELANAADRMVLGLPVLDAADVRGDGPRRTLDEQLTMFERHLIEEALEASAGRAAAASDLLGLPKKTLYDKLKRLGMAADDFRP